MNFKALIIVLNNYERSIDLSILHACMQLTVVHQYLIVMYHSFTTLQQLDQA